MLLKIPKSSLKEGTIKFSLKYGSTLQEMNFLEISSDFEKIRIIDDENIRIRFKYV